MLVIVSVDVTTPRNSLALYDAEAARVYESASLRGLLDSGPASLLCSGNPCATCVTDSEALFGFVIKVNRIEAGCARITPELLPLIDLTQAQIDTIVATVPGGASNVQDIYPLAPLQEGILFHHLMAQEGDPYLLWSLMRFADRGQLDSYVSALGAVIARGPG